MIYDAFYNVKFRELKKNSQLVQADLSSHVTYILKLFQHSYFILYVNNFSICLNSKKEATIYAFNL